jgi:hypothetical protein
MAAATQAKNQCADRSLQEARASFNLALIPKSERPAIASATPRCETTEIAAGLSAVVSETPTVELLFARWPETMFAVLSPRCQGRSIAASERAESLRNGARPITNQRCPASSALNPEQVVGQLPKARVFLDPDNGVGGKRKGAQNLAA